MKHILLLLTLIPFTQQLNAVTEAPDTIPQEPQTYGKDTKIGFELINEGPEPIWIAIQNGGSLLDQKGNNAVKILSPKNATKEQQRATKAGLPLPPVGTVKRLELDTAKDTLVMLWNQDPGTIKIKDIQHPGHISFKKPAAMFSFPKEKTIYIRYTLVPTLGATIDPLKKVFMPVDKKYVGIIQPQMVRRGGGPVRTFTQLAATNNVSENDIKGIPVPA